MLTLLNGPVHIWTIRARRQSLSRRTHAHRRRHLFIEQVHLSRQLPLSPSLDLPITAWNAMLSGRLHKVVARSFAVIRGY
jgi:hypothetical protein